MDPSNLFDGRLSNLIEELLSSYQMVVSQFLVLLFSEIVQVGSAEDFQPILQIEFSSDDSDSDGPFQIVLDEESSSISRKSSHEKDYVNLQAADDESLGDTYTNY